MASSPSRTAVAIVAALAAVTASVAIPETASAAPRTAPATTATTAGVPVPTTRITLVTGDTVDYSRDASGRVAATFNPGTGRESIGYRGYTSNGDYYVVPSDAEPDLAAGLLDNRLFDISYLAANDFTDVPLILQYRAGAARPQLAAAQQPTALPSINGAAVHVSKAQAGTFWTGIRGSAAAARAASPSASLAPAALAGGISKVWLDGRVTALDDVSDPQIGAPAAWAAGLDGTGMSVGIVDTGIDATHPDLVGKVAASHNFVSAGQPGGGAPDDVTDRFGHGTHVASILAGTGAASDGRYKGVAPGARLLIAKALDDSGSGSDSDIIAAMQWEAGTEHARIVSMSLGGQPTDGTDPLSEAVDTLTAQYGTLFVIAAGNAGPDSGTVAEPGAATAALTVGAVDAHDQLAGFSSRGPRAGDFAVKPEITAPGVGIVAARAAGTSMGTPLDRYYTAASGTSMATPHVAGAAAILAEQHPDWTADRLKAALVASAHDDGDPVWAQGAGRVDIARAITAPVLVDTASVSVHATWPGDGTPVTRTVTFTNTGTAEADLTLSLGLSGVDGKPAADGLAAVSPATLAVPAGGTATATVTVDPTKGVSGLYGGLLTAADAAGDHLSVPVGVEKQAKQDTLTVRLVAGPHQHIYGGGINAVIAARVNDTDPALAEEPTSSATYGWRQVDGAGSVFEAHLSLADGGVYHLETEVPWRDETLDRDQWALPILPQQALTGDTTVTFDLTKAVPVQVDTPKASLPVTTNVSWSRTTAAGQQYLTFFGASYPSTAPGRIWVLPSAAPTVGGFWFTLDQVRIAPQVTVGIAGRDGRTTVDPIYVTDHPNGTPMFTGDRRLPLVTGGNLRGALLLSTASTVDGLVADLDRAAAGGAAGVLTGSRLAETLVGRPDLTVPLLWVDATQAAAVQAIAGGRATADVRAQAVTPYEYKLAWTLRDRIPTAVRFRPAERDLTRLDTAYHAEFPAPAGTWGAAPDANEVDHTYLGQQWLSVKISHSFTAPTARTEYYNTTGSDVLWWRQYEFTPDQSAVRLESAYRGFVRPTTGAEDWNEPAVPAGASMGPQDPTGATAPNLPCDACRQGDTLRVRSLAPLGVGQYGEEGDASHLAQDSDGSEETHLYAGGTELSPRSDAYGLAYYALPAGAATYRLSDTYRTGAVGQHLASTVSTDWTFRSARPAADQMSGPYHCVDTLLYGDTDPCAFQPLVQLGWHLGLALDDSARPGPYHFSVTATAGQPGTPDRLTAVRAWTSTDGGAHWHPATAHRTRTGWQLDTTNPASGTVTLRVQATDTAGNTVDQTITNAFTIH